MQFYCRSEMVDVQITPIDRVVCNLFDRILLQAFRFAAFLSASPRWSKCSNKLGGNICVLIFRCSERVFKLISKWKEQVPTLKCPLSRINIEYIAACAFYLLWGNGPARVNWRKPEMTAIGAHLHRLHQLKGHMVNGECIQVPAQLLPPFDKFIL